MASIGNLQQKLDAIDLNSAKTKLLMKELFATRSQTVSSDPKQQATSSDAKHPPKPVYDDKDDVENEQYNDREPEKALGAKYQDIQSYIDFTRPQVYLMLGKPKSGKSHLTKWLLYYYFNSGKVTKNKPYWAIVFSGSKFNDDYKDMIPENALLEHSDNTLEEYVEYLKNLKEKTRGEMPHSILVLDDVVGIFNSSNKTFQNLVTIHRHLNLTIMISVQYLLGKVSTTFRECVSAGFIFNTMKENSVKGIHSVFGQLFEDKKEFKQHFMEATKAPHTCMMCLADEQNLSRNCLRFKAPKKFPQTLLKFSTMKIEAPNSDEDYTKELAKLVVNNQKAPDYAISKFIK